MIGYHFIGNTLRDGGPIPPDGEWLVHEGPIVPCESGLHCSEHPCDALRYSSGNTLCLVELDGEIAPHGDPVDKYVGRRRRIIKRIDAEHLLRRFAADQALSVIHLWDAPAVVRQYLETLDETLREAAMDAAANAAWSGAEWAAWVWSAALPDAHSAARNALVDLGSSVALNHARREFKSRVEAALS